jgi:hypothetical protein
MHLFRGHGDQRGGATALVEMVDLALHYNPTDQASYERRKSLAEQALAIFRELNPLGRLVADLAQAVGGKDRRGRRAWSYRRARPCTLLESRQTGWLPGAAEVEHDRERVEAARFVRDLN